MTVKMGALLLFFLSAHAFGITSDVFFLKVRDSHLIFDDKLEPRQVAITFSGKIIPEILSKILKKLKDEDLLAHFFFQGDSALEHPALIAQLASLGHIVGSQGLGAQHLQDGHISESEMLAEIQTGHEAVFSTLGFVYPFVRLAPRQGSLAVREMIKESGAFAFYWNIDFYPENPAQSMRDNLKREDYRGIVSLSLSKESTLVALDALIDEIKKEDLTVVTIVPSREASWKEYPPLIRKSIRDEIFTNGSIYMRQLKKEKERGGYAI